MTDKSGSWNPQLPAGAETARIAYPDLASAARKFTVRWFWMLSGLGAWLAFTCILSWHIAAGEEVVAQFDDLVKKRETIQGKIASAEMEALPEEALMQAAADAIQKKYADLNAKSLDTAGVAQVMKEYVALVRQPNNQMNMPVLRVQSGPIVGYCHRPRLLPLIKLQHGEQYVGQFHNATERRLCEDWYLNTAQLRTSRQSLVEWLRWTQWSTRIFFPITNTNNVSNAQQHADLLVAEAGERREAVVLLKVLGTTLLPVLYAVLGAGATVVRNIWTKRRENTLSPRDLPLSLGQLVLGAVVGACIGLFVTEDGNAFGGDLPLGLAALSFLAGFAVEGVFVALERLSRQVFPPETTNPTTPGR